MIITIQPGQTLSGIAAQYGTDWRTLAQVNKIANPDLIYAGQKLIIPDNASSGGSLAGTLPSINNAAAPAQTAAVSKTLPTTETTTEQSLDQMTLLQRVLQKGLQMSMAANLGSQAQAEMQGLNAASGFAPEKVSGNTVGDIINFLQSRVAEKGRSEISDVNDIINSLIKQQADLEARQNKLRDDARAQISQAVNSNMWNNMSDEQRKMLWNAAGYIGEPVSAKATKNTQITEIGGRKVLIDMETGQQISDLGASGASSVGQSIFSNTQLKQMSTATNGELDEETANDIYTLLMQGATLEQIRQGLRQIGKDPYLLDVFDRISPIYKILGQEKPNTSDTSLSQLLQLITED